MNAKKIFSLVLLFSIINGALTTTAFAGRQHRKIHKKIHELEQEQDNLRAELDALKEKEKAFVAEITLCIEKVMERMALSDWKTTDREKIQEAIASHKVCIQEMLEKK